MRLTGTSSAFPDSVRGTSAICLISFGACLGEQSSRIRRLISQKEGRRRGQRLRAPEPPPPPPQSVPSLPPPPPRPPQRPPRHPAEPHRQRRDPAHERGAHVGAAGGGEEPGVGAELVVDPP